MPPASQSEHRKRWEERSVIVALILAILVPGLGHLFQGRILKAFIYFFGIIGLFVWGVKLGEGVVVYNLSEKGPSTRITLHYAAQLGAGAIAYPALWQQKRVLQEGNRDIRQLDKPMTSKFTGRLTNVDDESHGGKLEGTVEFKPEQGEFGSETKGTFVGTLDGKTVTLPLAGGFYLDREIGAGFHRKLKCGVIADANGGPASGQMIVGSIPRPIIDGYGVPPDFDQLQELTGRLGKLHELALVFTWIAGLLNVLAIWDCVQGPAYGFGDETWTATVKGKDPSRKKQPSPKPLNPAATSV